MNLLICYKQWGSPNVHRGQLIFEQRRKKLHKGCWWLWLEAATTREASWFLQVACIVSVTWGDQCRWLQWPFIISLRPANLISLCDVALGVEIYLNFMLFILFLYHLFNLTLDYQLMYIIIYFKFKLCKHELRSSRIFF